MEFKLCEEMKVEISFLENRIFQQSLDRKLMFLIGVYILGQHPYL